MNPELSLKSFESISKSNDEQNSSIMTNTMNPNIAKLSFRVKYETKYGQTLYIIGNIEELGEWDPSKAIPMATSKDIYPTWKITKEFSCPLGMEIFYKYLVKEGNNIYWEELSSGKNQNRHIVIQSPGNLIIFDEKSNNISKIKTMTYNPNSNNTANVSHTTTNILVNILSNLSLNNNVNGNINFNNNNNGNNINNNNNNFLSSNMYIASFQSLSSFQKESDFSLIKMNEGENEDNNYFNNCSSKDITYELLNEENSNYEIDPHLEMIDLCQNIQQEDKIIIVTTFLPFIIESKDSGNTIDINTSNSSNINIKFNLTLYDDKLVNLIFYSLKTMNICEVHWVGILRGLEEYPEKVQLEISEYLENKKIYVVMTNKKDLTNFQIYINKILYPLYNNSEIDINSHFFQNPDSYYAGFLNVNKAFGETINSCINDDFSKMVFINDIDLAFIPSYLLNKNLKVNMCLFIHNNFPEYDILSLMHTNKDILKSLLLCNTLGFQSFSQAKNFFTSIKIYFNIDYKVRFDGLFYIEYMKRDIPIYIRNSHLEMDIVKSIYSRLDIKENINTKISNYRIINLLTFDYISNIYDIINKLNLFLDLNESNFLGYKYKLDIIIIKDKYFNKYLNEENEKNQNIIGEKIKIINDKLGQDFINLFNISFVEFISVKEQIKYFINANIFLFTDINLSIGTRTLIQEFIAVKTEMLSNPIKNNGSFKEINNNSQHKEKENTNDIKNYKNEKLGIIVSVKINIPEELKFIKKANFLDLNNIKNELKSIIEMNDEEKIKIINNDCIQIKKKSTTLWIKDCLCELKKTKIFNKKKIRIKLGYGLDSPYYQINKNIRTIIPKNLPISFHSSSTKLFLIDLNSILTNINYYINENKDNNININIESNNNNFNNINDINNSFIDNNKKILNLLSNLSNDNNNIIYLITNKTKDTFKELNLNPINFGFIAEEGLIIKPYGEKSFKNILNVVDNNWKNTLEQLFINFTNKVGMGNISQKEFSISWNYKNNENNNGYLIGQELKFLVENAIDKSKFDIILEKNSLEIKIKNYNKNHYILEIIQKLVNERKNFNFIFGLNNNDKVGEEFFDYLYKMENDFKENNKNLSLFTVVIGKKTTRAKYYIKDITSFIEVFKAIDIKK